MTRVEKSIEIIAPPEKVWEMLALDRFQEWQVGLASRILRARKSFPYKWLDKLMTH